MSEISVVQRFEAVQKLNEDYNAAKKITIKSDNKNSYTLVIKHDTKDRGHLFKYLENIAKLENIIACTYVQRDVGLGFRVLPEIFQYVFKDAFVGTLANGTKVNVREHNSSTVYINALIAINDAKTVEELDKVSYKFLSPSGITVDINEKANKMLLDATVSEDVKKAIVALQDENGEVNLIQPIRKLI